MLVYDAFTFYNEFDLLQVRLVEHDPFVDFFVIAEGDRTFTGRPNRFHLDLADPRFAPFSHKIIQQRVELNPQPDSPWVNECRQRNSLLDSIDLHDDDCLLISDVDEIVSRQHWPRLLRQVHAVGAMALRMRLYYYFINLQSTLEWESAKLCSGEYVRTTALRANDIRRKSHDKCRQFCGWHFSYIGSIEFIQNKLRSFSHDEFSTEEFTSMENIKSALEEGRDLFGRQLDFVAVPLRDSWPLQMVADAYWRHYACRPASVARRFSRFCLRPALASLKHGGRRIMQRATLSRSRRGVINSGD